jgi:hypothetical protein
MFELRQKLAMSIIGLKATRLGMIALAIVTVSQAITTARSEVKPNSYDADRLELVYSKNDSLCKRLTKVYAELQQTHIYADLDTGRTDLAWNWEDRYPKKFAAVGINQAAPLRDAIHPYSSPLSVHEVPAESGYLVPTNQRMYAYYRVDMDGDGVLRVVHIEDLPLGGTTLFGTNVWILRPSMDIDPNQIHDQYSVGPKDQLSPDKVDLAIFFAIVPGGAEQYHFIKAPYFFEKILDDRQRKLPVSDRLLSQPYVGGNSTIQRLFEFRSHFYFVARLGFTALVYEFTKDRQIEDVCYVTTRKLSKQKMIRG